MKIFLTTILIVINLFSQDIDTNLQLTTQEKEFIEKTHFNVARYFVPKSFPTIPAVGGTVASQVKPIAIEKI